MTNVYKENWDALRQYMKEQFKSEQVSDTARLYCAKILIKMGMLEDRQLDLKYKEFIDILKNNKNVSKILLRVDSEGNEIINPVVYDDSTKEISKLVELYTDYVFSNKENNKFKFLCFTEDDFQYNKNGGMDVEIVECKDNQKN